MVYSIRRVLFVIFAVFFRLPIWAIVWLIGRTGVIKTVFVIYPHDQKEYRKLCPNNKLFLKFLSGRPTPGGIILDRWKPVGIYLYISNPPAELIRKKNRHIAESIVRRMQWIQKISGAKAIGFAGQLGPILEKRHGIAMKPPFFSSTMGNIFSIDNAVSFLAGKSNMRSKKLHVTVLGGGELGIMLQEHFAEQGHNTEIVDIKMKRRGGLELKDADEAHRQLGQADFIVNLLQKGEEFISAGIPELLKPSTTIIDFSRPAIPREKINAKVFMGNRVQRPGMRFACSLPGWTQQQLPACSIPSIMASNFGVVEQNLTKFCEAARDVAFETALAAVPKPAPQPLLTRLQLFTNRMRAEYGFSLSLVEERLAYDVKERSDA